MRKQILSSIVLFLAISVNLFAQQQNLTEKIKRIDEICQESLELWKVPGMAIAIVTADTVVFAKGYGVCDIEKRNKVDENSVFAIASNTKTFTATAMAILVEEGKLSWDDKVVDHLPWFQLYDPYVTANITIRDLLCHRSGLETFSGDLIWYGSNYSAQEVIERARYLKPVYGFREHFGYSNILFLTAGEIIAKVSGMSWVEFIEERFLIPLEMSRTKTSTNDLTKMKNLSAPHNILDDDKIIAIPYLNWDNIAPAGSMFSSATDMAKWLMLHLNKGKYKNQEIFSEEIQNEMWQMHTPQNVSLNAKNLWSSTHYKGYGLGWSLSLYYGRKICGHNGGYDGMISQSTIIPEENLAFVILTNANSSMYYPLMYHILDILLYKEDTNWNNLFHQFQQMQDIRAKEEKEEELQNRPKNTKASLELEEYTGNYYSDVYGTAKISIKNKKLYFEMMATAIFESSLEHLYHNTFQIQFEQVPSLPEGSINFLIGANAKVYEMQVNVPNPDFDFTELEFVKE
jgi:CubicO group peptidase (beta-lactamase class C family)